MIRTLLRSYLFRHHIALFEAAPAESKKRFEAVAQAARDGLNDVHRSIKALRPDALERAGLAEALEAMIQKFQESTSAQVQYEQLAGPLLFAQDTEDTLYRVIQEGMTNAVRHGHALEIQIRLTRQDDLLTIDIRDDGLGCEQVEAGFGLRHMKERLDLLSGSLTCVNRSDLEKGRRGFYLIVRKNHSDPAVSRSV